MSILSKNYNKNQPKNKFDFNQVFPETQKDYLILSENERK